jgi:hypothetical protein
MVELPAPKLDQLGSISSSQTTPPTDLGGQFRTSGFQLYASILGSRGIVFFPQIRA